jgi:hypothetical protein
MKYSPWSSRLGVGHETNDPTSEKFTGMKPWRRPRPHRVVVPVEKKIDIC